MGQFLPARMNGGYRGHPAALWILGLILLATCVISFNSIAIGRTVAEKADGIPLSTFSAAGADAVLSLFALWGISQLALRLFAVLILLRYRALVPLTYAVLLGEALARRAVLLAKPIASSAGAPGFPINVVLIALMTTGLGLSLWQRRRPRVA